MNPDEYKTTENHDTIQEWVEKRYGNPALVEGIVDKGNAAAMLRMNFHDHQNEGLKDISWELFFEIFDENDLLFLYQEGIPNGDENKSYKFMIKR